jgi:hypothetical protein
MTNREHADQYWTSGRMRLSQSESADKYFLGRSSNTLTGSEIEFIWENEFINKPVTVEDVAKANYSYEYGEETYITDGKRDAFIEGAFWRASNTKDLFTPQDMREFAMWCAKNYKYHKGCYTYKFDLGKKKQSININDLLEKFKIKK